uniref:Probable dual-specificity RNA methyltransferase RlmN n=1 Tax=uncultured Mycoplasmataceae bacterium TaxID=300027 RepID=A0A6G9HHJ2_9MOLU|nr:putative dual-specificity RNA methyltransferase RlmN [uncultured Mycoplasmataceae bacterium]
MQENRTSIYSYSLEQLEEKVISLGLKKFNAKQIFQWIYQQNVDNFDAMSNIAKSSIEVLKKNFRFNKLIEVTKQIDPIDETTKFLFKLEDDRTIETVLMKFDYGYSICVSSQIGCNMGCKFCASGLLKKVRGLNVDELVLQVITVNRYLKENKNSRISNLVVMGIGEPFDNYDNLKSFLQILNSPFGIGLGSRHITVSTCGLIDKIVKFGQDFPQMNLAISLHAPTNEIRNKIMPVNQAYPLEKLIDSLVKYQKITQNRIGIEYIMLKDLNDSTENAKQLIKLLNPIYCYVNLIRYNNVVENEFKTSKNIDVFSKVLNDSNIIATIRLERGSKIAAACGQLRANYEKGK